jgi:hypothetical protein
MAQTIVLEVDEETLARARRVTQERGQSLEAVLAETVRSVGERGRAGESEDRVLGAFEDDPELLDRVVVEAFENRKRDAWRASA